MEAIQYFVKSWRPQATDPRRLKRPLSARTADTGDQLGVRIVRRNRFSNATLCQSDMVGEMTHDDLRLKELSVTLQNRAGELTLAREDDIAVLMSGVAVTLEALLVLAQETRSPRSGPSEE